MEIDDKILKYVKEHSPKSYAKKIERRCLAVIKKLKKLLDTPDDQIPHVVFVKHGCPHCKDCSKCLWTKAAKEFEFYGPDDVDAGICIYIHFRGVTWLGANSMVKLIPKGVEIRPWTNRIGGACQLTEDPELYKRCMDFLEGHIDWAREKGWGKYYKA